MWSRQELDYGAKSVALRPYWTTAGGPETADPSSLLFQEARPPLTGKAAGDKFQHIFF